MIFQLSQTQRLLLIRNNLECLKERMTFTQFQVYTSTYLCICSDYNIKEKQKEIIYNKIMWLLTHTDTKKRNDVVR